MSLNSLLNDRDASPPRYTFDVDSDSDSEFEELVAYEKHHLALQARLNAHENAVGGGGSRPAKKQKNVDSGAVLQPKGTVRKHRRAPGEVVQKEIEPFRLFSLPGELIDKIFSSQALNLRDHLSLAASSRSLRSMYIVRGNFNPSNTGHVWHSLMVARPLPEEGNLWDLGRNEVGTQRGAAEGWLKRMWTTERRTKPEDLEVLDERGKAIRSVDWESAIRSVHSQYILKTKAKSVYKLNDRQLSDLPEFYLPHPANKVLFKYHLEAAVEALALKLHGGILGHEALLKKRAAIGRKISRKAEGRYVIVPAHW